MGPSVNLAARLMCQCDKYGVDLLVDVLRCYDSSPANMPIVRVMVPRVMALKPRFVAARDRSGFRLQTAATRRVAALGVDGISRPTLQDLAVMLPPDEALDVVRALEARLISLRYRCDDALDDMISDKLKARRAAAKGWDRATGWDRSTSDRATGGAAPRRREDERRRIPSGPDATKRRRGRSPSRDGTTRSRRSRSRSRDDAPSSRLP